MSTVRVAQAISLFKNGKRDKALEMIASMESIANRNLDQGDDISLYRLILAVAEFFRDNRMSALGHLAKGLSNKAPMSFEGINHLSIYSALGWYDDAEFNQLIQTWENNNQQELSKIFKIACGKDAYRIWTPLPESCENYL